MVGTLSGADAAFFSFFAGNCGYTPIAAGKSCSGGVTFTPNAARTFNATLTIPSNDPNSPAVAALAGVGGAASLASFGPAAASFGTVASGSTSAATQTPIATTPASSVTGKLFGIWLTNQAANSISEFDNTGAPLSSSSGYTDPSLAGPPAIALDQSGNAWVANSTGNSVTMIAPGGAACSSFNGNSLAAPSSVAIDGFGNVFVANQTTATIVELSGSGALLSTTPYSGGGLNQPSAIAINAR